METIKHILGFCGESHINIFTVILFIALANFDICRKIIEKLKFEDYLHNEID